MRVYIDKEIANPYGVFRRGERVNLPDDTALELIEAGYARNVVVWLASLAAEEGFDIKPQKKPKKLEDLLSF